MYWLFINLKDMELAVIDTTRGWLSKQVDAAGNGDITWIKTSIDELNDTYIYSFEEDGSSFTTPEELMAICAYPSAVLEEASSFEEFKLRTIDDIKQAYPELFI